MNNLKDYEKYNESVGAILLAVIGGYCWYKFLQQLAKRQTNKKTIKGLTNILEDMKKYQPESFSVSEYDDRYFISHKTVDNFPHIRIFKNTQELRMGENILLQLDDEEYNKFLEIIKDAL